MIISSTYQIAESKARVRGKQQNGNGNGTTAKTEIDELYNSKQAIQKQNKTKQTTTVFTELASDSYNYPNT